MKKSSASKSRKVRDATARYRVGSHEESGMTLIEQIQKQLMKLPPEKQREVLDFVAFLQFHSHKLPELTTDVKRSKRIKELLKQLAAMKVFSDISDPVDWQRKIRKDRPLPGRAAGSLLTAT